MWLATIQTDMQVRVTGRNTQGQLKMTMGLPKPTAPEEVVSQRDSNLEHLSLYRLFTFRNQLDRNGRSTGQRQGGEFCSHQSSQGRGTRRINKDGRRKRLARNREWRRCG